MLNVFKMPYVQLIAESNDEEIKISIENRYGLVESFASIVLDKDDALKLYNQIGKILGYPEMKNNA